MPTNKKQQAAADEEAAQAQAEADAADAAAADEAAAQAEAEAAQAQADEAAAQQQEIEDQMHASLEEHVEKDPPAPEPVGQPCRFQLSPDTTVEGFAFEIGPDGVAGWVETAAGTFQRVRPAQEQLRKGAQAGQYELVSAAAGD